MNTLIEPRTPRSLLDNVDSDGEYEAPVLMTAPVETNFYLDLGRLSFEIENVDTEISKLRERHGRPSLVGAVLDTHSNSMLEKYKSSLSIGSLNMLRKDQISLKDEMFETLSYTDDIITLSNAQQMQRNTAMKAHHDMKLKYSEVVASLRAVETREQHTRDEVTDQRAKLQAFERIMSIPTNTRQKDSDEDEIYSIAPGNRQAALFLNRLEAYSFMPGRGRKQVPDFIQKETELEKVARLVKTKQAVLNGSQDQFLGHTTSFLQEMETKVEQLEGSIHEAHKQKVKSESNLTDLKESLLILLLPHRNCGGMCTCGDALQGVWSLLGQPPVEYTKNPRNSSHNTSHNSSHNNIYRRSSISSSGGYSNSRTPIDRIHTNQSNNKGTLLPDQRRPSTTRAADSYRFRLSRRGTLTELHADMPRTHSSSHIYNDNSDNISRGSIDSQRSSMNSSPMALPDSTSVNNVYNTNSDNVHNIYHMDDHNSNNSNNSNTHDHNTTNTMTNDNNTNIDTHNNNNNTNSVQNNASIQHLYILPPNTPMTISSYTPHTSNRSSGNHINAHPSSQKQTQQRIHPKVITTASNHSNHLITTPTTTSKSKPFLITSLGNNHTQHVPASTLTQKVLLRQVLHDPPMAGVASISNNKRAPRPSTAFGVRRSSPKQTSFQTTFPN